MPTIVDVPGLGELEFPDGLSREEMAAAIDDRYSKIQPARQAVPVEEEPPATSDNLLQRFGASVSENTMQAVQGLGRIAQFTPQLQSIQTGMNIIGLGDYGPVQQAGQVTELASDIQANTRPSYGVTEPADTLLEKVVEGVGSLPAVVAAGPAAPIVNAAMMGEQQRQEAEAAGASPAKQALAFGGGATVGAVSEYLLGVPAMLRGGGGRRIIDTALLGFAREGTQEALEQGAQNVLAKSLYDSDRELTEGVKESALVGGIIGAPLGVGLQGVREGEAAPPPLPEAPNLNELESLFEESKPISVKQEQVGPLPDFQTWKARREAEGGVADEAYYNELKAAEVATPPLVVTPTQEASAKSLGADPVELRQQEAIVTGEPIPATEEDLQATEESAQEPIVDQITATEGQDTTQAVEEAPAPTGEAETAIPVEPPFRKNLLSSEAPRALLPEEQAVFDKAREELKGMKQAGKEGGATTLPQIVIDAGHTLYRKGMDFVEWSAEMVKQLGEAIKPHLEAAWNTITTAVNATSPAGRRFKKSGTIGKAQSDEVYSVFSDDLQHAKTDTRPNESFGEADKQAIIDAYQSLQQENGQGSQRIADVMERAGFPLSAQSKGLVMQMFNDGQITGLAHGDWSLSNARTRAWGVKRLGEVALRMEIPAQMKRSAPSPEGGAVGGQGGRRGGEAVTAPSEEPTAVGIFNASTDAARIKMGLPPAMEPLRRSFPLVWDEAMKVIEQRPNVGSDLVTSLKANPRNLRDVETAILAHERVKRETEFDQAVDAVNSASNEDDRLDAEARLSRARDANQDLFSVAESSGTKGGQELAARKILVNQDFSLARMEAETRAVANRGKPLSQKQIAEIKELHDALKAAKDRIAQLEEEQSKKDSQATFAKLMKELKSDRKEAVKQGKSVTDFLNEQADKARERLKGKLNQFGSAPDPTILVDLAIIGSSHVANGINTIGEFSAQMVSEFGDWITPHLPDIFKQSQEFHQSNQEDFAPKVKAAKVEPTAAKILEGATAELDPKLVFQLARAYVREGVEGADNVIARVHADLVKLNPDLTIRDVRDAFTGYGKVTYPSQEEDKKKLREYKEILRLTSQLEDVQKRMAPLRTGPQRDKMGIQARELQKRINDLMRQYGIQSTSPEQQLKSSIDAVKTRLRNEIEELDRAIATSTPRPSGKSTLQYDEEAKALRDQRDRKKAQYDAIFTPPGKTAEEKIAARLKALDQAVAAEAQLLREGILKRPPNAAPVTSPAIENKLMELDAMRQLRRELYAATQPKKAPEDIALEQAVKAAKESINRLDEQLRTGNIGPKTKQPRFTPSQELEALWSERDAMRDALMELRKAQKPRTDPEERARKATIKALEKSVKNLEQRIFNKDFSPQPRKAGRPDTKEVAALRDLRDQMRKTFTDLKKAQTPVRSREEINLARDKKNIINRTKKLQEKIDAGDYAPEPKKDPAMDKEKRDLQFQYEKTREKYLRGVFEAGLKNEGLIRKGTRAVGETLNFSRAVMTGIDMSAVFRQGGMLAFAKPITAAKALPSMFKAALSEKSEFETMQEIRNRPNYPLYKMAKLDFTEDAPLSLTKMEEQYASRWVQKLPALFGGGLLRGSQRAYVTFLNRMRADSFDAMVNGFVMNGKPTKEEARAIANFINVATGRGALPAKFAGGAHVLNMAIFAPRYVLSRFQLLMGQPFWGGNAKTRAVIAGMYGRYLIGIATVLGLLAAWKDDKDPPIETDPRSTDFLKIRYGNTRLDPFSGLLQATTLISRVGTQSKKTQGGQIVSTKAPLKYGQQTTWDTITSFLRSKLAPTPGAVVDYTTGTNVVGEPVSGKQALGRLVVPISFEDVNKVMQEQGVPKGVALSLLSLFGMGLNTYQPKAKSTKSKDGLSTKL